MRCCGFLRTSVSSIVLRGRTSFFDIYLWMKVLLYFLIMHTYMHYTLSGLFSKNSSCSSCSSVYIVKVLFLIILNRIYLFC